MKKLLPFVFVLISLSTLAQSHAVKWGEMERVKGRLLYLLPSDSNEFYALRWTGGRLFGRYKLSRHEDLVNVKSGNANMVAEKSVGNFEGARVIGGNLVTFLSDRRDFKNNFFMQVYNQELEEEGEPVKLASYDLEKGMKKGSFNVRISANEKFFGVVWVIPGKKENRDKYGFKIFDVDLNLKNEGEYPLPFESELSTIHEHHISDNGEYFLTVTEYNKPEKKTFFKSKKDYKALHIIHIAEDGLQDFELDFDGKRIDAMAMSSDENGIFTITGIYGDKDKLGVEGVFHQKVDVESREILHEGFKAFDKEFITQGWTEREKKRASRRQSNGKGEPQLYNYMMREATLMADGGIVGTMEQYYIQVTTTTNSQSGQTTNTYEYYYNDIIAYRINVEGEFEWIEKIRKDQVSTNDGGPYSSYESFIDKGKLYFIFNDNSKNYSETGSFLDNDKLYTANYGKRKNAVAIASVDLETGEKTRKSFFDRTDIQAIVVPKMFNVDFKNNQVIFYAIWGRKEKIGVLKFED